MKPSAVVLLVDDDDAFREVMGGELEQLGFEVTAVGSGVEAVAKASTLAPSVVLLNVHLQDADGLQVLRAIRETSPGSEVIMLSGNGSVDTAVEAVQSGAFDFVANPCPLAELEARIERALQRSGIRPATSPREPGATSPDRLPTLEELERTHIERVLRATGGHRADAARILGISERNLYRKIGEYDL